MREAEKENLVAKAAGLAIALAVVGSVLVLAGIRRPVPAAVR